MDKQIQSIYEKYELKNYHYDEQALEDAFRHGFVMGYCAACDQRKPYKKQSKNPRT